MILTLHVVSRKNLRVPSKRITAGIYVSINVVDAENLNQPSSDKSAVWDDIVTRSCICRLVDVIRELIFCF